MQLPSKIVFTESPPSDVVGGNLLTGDEIAIITLSVYRDVHVGPGTLPVSHYFKNSSFLSTLQKIIIADDFYLGGKMGELKSELISHDAVSDMSSHIIESDYTDLMDVSCNEAVPGIFTVCAKIEGETKVSCLRNLDKMILDSLFVEIVTDYFLLQSGGPVAEN